MLMVIDIKICHKHGHDNFKQVDIDRLNAFRGQMFLNRTKMENAIAYGHPEKLDRHIPHALIEITYVNTSNESQTTFWK